MPHAGELWGLEQGDGEPVVMVLMSSDGAILTTDDGKVFQINNEDE